MGINQRMIGVQQTGYGIDAGRFQYFSTGHFRHDPRHTPGQHGLAPSRGADQQDIMGTGRSHLNAPFSSFLAFYLGKIRYTAACRYRFITAGGIKFGTFIQISADFP